MTVCSLKNNSFGTRKKKGGAKEAQKQGQAGLILLGFVKEHVVTLGKGTIAGLSVLAVAVLVAGGGYAVSMAKYADMLGQAKTALEQDINDTLGLGKYDSNRVSVDLYEEQTGFFNHDLMFVATDGQNKVKVPLTVGIRYAGYDFELDLVNATVDDQNLLKYYQLNQLTDLSLSGDFSLLTGKGHSKLTTSFLNSDELIKEFAEYQGYFLQHYFEDDTAPAADAAGADAAAPAEFEAAAETEVATADTSAAASAEDAAAAAAAAAPAAAPVKARTNSDVVAEVISEAAVASERKSRAAVREQLSRFSDADWLKEQIGYKPVGTLDIDVTFDLEEHFALSLKLDHVLSDSISLSDVKLYSEFQGLHEVKNLGRSDFAVGKLTLFGVEPVMVDRLVARTNSHLVGKDSLNCDYSIALSKVNDVISDLNIAGQITGLNRSALTSGTLGTMFEQMSNQPLTVSFNKGSGFTFPALARIDDSDKVEPRQVRLSFDGEHNFSVKDDGFDQVLVMNLKLNTAFDTDVSKISNYVLNAYRPLLDNFKLKDGKSEAVVEFNQDENGHVFVHVNGKEPLSSMLY